jgi:hypothetical protein
MTPSLAGRAKAACTARLRLAFAVLAGRAMSTDPREAPERMVPFITPN